MSDGELITIGEVLAANAKDPEAWTKALLSKEGGIPRPTLGNAIRILENDPKVKDLFAFDEQASRVVLTRGSPWRDVTPANEALSDEDGFRLVQWFELHYRMPISAKAAQQAIGAVSIQRPRNRLVDWLKSLKWDGKPRAESWLHRIMGADDDEWTRTVGSAFLVSAVARALQPGCQVDHVLVLEGQQGAGKSTAMRLLAGDENFSDSIPDLHSKDASISLASTWILELAEIAAMRRSEVTAVKAFITRRVDKFRPPYGTCDVMRPRRCVFVATTNEGAYLHDATGNRRFWPVRCGVVNLEALKRHREQLWAEAVHLFRAGENWWLTTEALHRRAEEEQAERLEADPWEEKVVSFADAHGKVTCAEVLKELGIAVAERTRAHEMRVGQILRALKWDRKRTRLNGCLSWVYEKPPDVPTVPTSVPTSGEGRNTEKASDSASLGEVFLPFLPKSPAKLSDSSETLKRTSRNSRNGRNNGVQKPYEAVPTSGEGRNTVGTEATQTIVDDIWGGQ